MEQTIERTRVPVRTHLELTEDELELIRASLHLLLSVEDDHELIPQLKVLLARIEQREPVAAG